MTACPTCGAPAEAEDRFCPNCGSPLGGEAPRQPAVRFCTRCGSPLDREDRFCGSCGARVRLPAEPIEEAMAVDPVVPEVSEQEDEDLLADWDLLEAEALMPAAPPVPLPPAADQRPTESIPRYTDRTAEGPETRVRPAAGDLRWDDYLEPAPAQPTPGREPPRGFPLGASVALIGAVAVIVSAILEWRGPFGGTYPRDISARLLLDPGGAAGPNLGVVLLVAGTVGALVALLTMALPWLRFVRRLIGLLTLALPVAFVLRTIGVQDQALASLPGLLGPGVYAAGAGALLQLVAGKWTRR